MSGSDGARRASGLSSQLMRFPASVVRDPAIEAWMLEQPGGLGAIAQRWFHVMRGCGTDVREVLHDGHPTACVGDAAFAYVNAFTAHVNVGFFRGAEIADPMRLLEGTGKFMRHVKLKPGRRIDAEALTDLIETAYSDMRERLRPSYSHGTVINQRQTEGRIVSEIDIAVGQLGIRYLIDGSHDLSMGVFELTVPPRSNVPPPHSHAHNEEIVYVLEGTLRYTVGPDTRDLTPGQTMHTPKGVVHGFSNPTDTAARALITLSPDIGAQYFKDVAAVVNAGGPPDKAAMAAVMSRYGLVPAIPR